MQALSDDLLSGAAAAGKFIGKPQRTIYRMVENGFLPVVRKGRSMYFRKSELVKAFSSEAA